MLEGSLIARPGNKSPIFRRRGITISCFNFYARKAENNVLYLKAEKEWRNHPYLIGWNISLGVKTIFWYLPSAAFAKTKNTQRVRARKHTKEATFTFIRPLIYGLHPQRFVRNKHILGSINKALTIGREINFLRSITCELYILIHHCKTWRITHAGKIEKQFISYCTLLQFIWGSDVKHRFNRENARNFKYLFYFLLPLPLWTEQRRISSLETCLTFFNRKPFVSLTQRDVRHSSSNEYEFL